MDNKNVKKMVHHHFGAGYHCAEVIAKTIFELFYDKPHNDVIRAASGFGGGIAGTTEELCGAFTGGILALSYFLGRENPGEALSQNGKMIKEFKKKFHDEFGSLTCKVLLDSFRDEEGQMGCVRVTTDSTIMLVDILKEFESLKGISINSAYLQHREKVEVGNCPFKCSYGAKGEANVCLTH